MSLVLLFGNLLIPFCGLLSRHAKRRKWSLAFWAVWLLAMHWIDLYWIVMPNLGVRAGTHRGLPLGAIDACLFVGIGGVYLAGLLHVAGSARCCRWPIRGWANRWRLRIRDKVIPSPEGRGHNGTDTWRRATTSTRR